MKRIDLLREAEAAKCDLKEGGEHTKVYKNGVLITEIPRHREINKFTADGILKKIRRA